jgi:phosphinothricin acetyltransferase
MKTEIRLAQLDDAAGIQAVYAPYCESSNVTFETVAPTRDEMAERITRIMSAYPWLVAETEGRVAGYVYASRFRERAAYRWTAEVAVYVALDEQQRGLGRALYTSLISILRAQGYVKAIAGITLPNAASVRLHEKLGFQKVGSFPGIGYKDGRWLDVGWWQLALQPEISGPPEPQPFPSICNGPAVVAALDGGRTLANHSI